MEMHEVRDYLEMHNDVVDKIEKVEAFNSTLNTSAYVQIKIPKGDIVTLYGKEKEHIALAMQMIASHLNIKKLLIETNVSRWDLKGGDSEEFQKEHNIYLDLREEFKKYPGKVAE